MLVENRQFEHSPPLFGGPVQDDPLEFRLNFTQQISRLHGLSHGAVCLILRLAVLVYNSGLCQTDRQTDGRTEGQTDTRRQQLA